MANALLNIKSPDEVTAQREEEARAKLPTPQVVTGLAAHVNKCWSAARDAKQKYLQGRMEKCLRLRRGEYSSEEMSHIKASGGSEIFLNITDEKAAAAIAWIESIIFQPGEKAWNINPTPNADLPPDEQARIAQQVEAEFMAQFGPLYPDDPNLPAIAQQVMARAVEIGREQKKLLKKNAQEQDELLEQDLADFLVDAKFDDALKDFIDNMVTFPSAILKGPVWKSKPTMTWDENGKPLVKEEIVLCIESVSPMDIYPSPRSGDVDDGFLFERHDMARHEVSQLIGVPGYNDDAIRDVLEHSGRKGVENWTNTANQNGRNRLEDKDTVYSDAESRFEALQFWGWVQGQMLLDWGLPAEQVEDPLADYAAEVWLIGSKVIKAELNGDKLGRRPYFKASFRPRSGSFWGQSLVELVADVQEACNASVRALINNMSIASGPQVSYDVDRMPEGHKLETLVPWGIHQWSSKGSPNTTIPAISFFQPNAMVSELWLIYEKFSSEADNRTGIPRFMYGQNVTSGTASTASGYSMMMDNMGKGIRKVINGLDKHVIGPAVQRTFEVLMLAGKLENYRGDIKIIARGASALLEKQAMIMRRNEFIQTATNNPVLQALVKPAGLAEIIRTQLRDMGIPSDDVVPTAEEINEQQAQAAQQAAAMQQAQAQMQPGLPPQGPSTLAPDQQAPPAPDVTLM